MVEAIKDPEVKGITRHVSRFERALIDRLCQASAKMNISTVALHGAGATWENGGDQ